YTLSYVCYPRGVSAQTARMRGCLYRPLLFLALAGPVFCAPAIPPMRPDIQGVFPRGGQRGTDVELVIRGKNLQGATQILFATPKLSAAILSVEHNMVRARFHVDASVEIGRHDFQLVAPHGSTIAWFDVSDRKETFEREPNNDRE